MFNEYRYIESIFFDEKKVSNKILSKSLTFIEIVTNIRDFVLKTNRSSSRLFLFFPFRRIYIILSSN